MLVLASGSPGSDGVSGVTGEAPKETLTFNSFAELGRHFGRSPPPVPPPVQVSVVLAPQRRAPGRSRGPRAQTVDAARHVREKDARARPPAQRPKAKPAKQKPKEGADAKKKTYNGLGVRSWEDVGRLLVKGGWTLTTKNSNAR